MKQFIVVGPDQKEVVFNNLAAAMEYIGGNTKYGTSKFNMVVKNITPLVDTKEIVKLENELKDLMGTFKNFQDDYCEFMQGSQKILADLQQKLYNLKSNNNAK